MGRKQAATARNPLFSYATLTPVQRTDAAEQSS